MTAKQIEDWKVERDIARDSGDPKLIQRAYDHRDDMMMECIQHQADRIKKSLDNDDKINAKLDKFEEQVKKDEERIVPLEKMKTEFNEMKLKAQGMKLLWDILKIVVGAGGGAFLMKMLGA